MKFDVLITEREKIIGPDWKPLDDAGLYALDGIAKTTVEIDAENEQDAIHKALEQYTPRLKLTDTTVAEIIER